jgi:hypothetical protein
MSRAFVRVTVSIKAELVSGQVVANKYDRKFILVAPDRQLIDELMQDATIETAAEKLIERLDEINEEHATLRATQD